MTYLLLLLLAFPFARHTAPDIYRVKFETTAGNFVIETHRDWAPRGADRFYELVRTRYYDDSRFFRVVAGRWAQFGINGSTQQLRSASVVTPSPMTRSNSTTPAALSPFPTPVPTPDLPRYSSISATTPPATTIEAGFAPFGQVVEGMDVVEKLYAVMENTQAAACGLAIRTKCLKAETHISIANFPNSTDFIRATILRESSRKTRRYKTNVRRPGQTGPL